MTIVEKIASLQHLIDTISDTKLPGFIYFDGERREVKVLNTPRCWTIEGYYNAADSAGTLYQFVKALYLSEELPKIIHRIELQDKLSIKEII